MKLKKAQRLISAPLLNSYLLIILDSEFEIALWMITCWANFWCTFTNVDMTAVSTFPNNDIWSNKDFFAFNFF